MRGTGWRVLRTAHLDQPNYIGACDLRLRAWVCTRLLSLSKQWSAAPRYTANETDHDSCAQEVPHTSSVGEHSTWLARNRNSCHTPAFLYCRRRYSERGFEQRSLDIEEGGTRGLISGIPTYGMRLHESGMYPALKRRAIFG